MTADPPRMWRTGGGVIPLDRPVLMGVLNVTPDSFSDGGQHVDPDSAVRAGMNLLTRGADIVDVGGESTRPGADPVDIDTEIERVLPVVEGLARRGAVVSIDTMKAGVAARAIEAGATIVNDVSGFEDPVMRDVAARNGVGVVVMHMQGRPRTMQRDPTYDDVVAEVGGHLLERSEAMIDAGCDPASVVVDPGIGFGKTIEHNLTLIDHLDDLVGGRYPVALGTSRKAFLGALTGRPVDERDPATAVTVAIGVLRGASIFRVHEPASAGEAAHVAWCILNGRAPNQT